LSITRAKTSSIAQGPSTNKNILAGNSVILPGSYESIQTYTLGSAQATITFSSIPATYKHLQLRILSKNTSADYSMRAQFNSDTASNYSLHGLYGTGSVAGAFGFANQTNGEVGMSADTTANVFAASVVDILDYANTNKYKTTRGLAGFDKNGAGSIDLRSSSWRSTSAVTSILLSSAVGNFAQYSSFALYGIK
jgi:hypothetical protein